ncbi:hypothetical protein [Moraxella sp.]|uniref:hypothetical protein n=1 Tax=Moraxella sp. TaxID=479 RepID=UPI0026DBD4CE|nr:hypothetical protein [Moraxella sp.]MDO4895442.1 hypothetical protein [Moraxella sp.]
MKLPKINIEQEKLDINLKFYLFLKYIIKAKLRDLQVNFILQEYQLFLTAKDLELFKKSVLNSFNQPTKIAKNQFDNLSVIFTQTNTSIDVEVLVFSLKLYLIRGLLKAEAEIKSISDLDKLKDLNPLSLEYDKITVFNPYAARVNGALLSLAFFESLDNGFMSKTTDEFILGLSKQSQELQKFGLEPNQIFMIAFTESINQSITSRSGSDYENRILSVLIGLGIDKDKIKKVHDNADKSTEFDLFFELNGKSYGIGAKRTLRERYKQFIKTAQMTKIDVMIEITLGTDLTQEKAKSITNHDVYLFVADEVYQDNPYLQDMDMVYSCQELSLDLLRELP